MITSYLLRGHSMRTAGDRFQYRKSTVSSVFHDTLRPLSNLPITPRSIWRRFDSRVTNHKGQPKVLPLFQKLCRST